MEKNNNNVKNNSESNSKNNNNPNQHNSNITNGDKNRQNTNESRRYHLCTKDFCKGRYCEYKYKEQPLCKDIGCKVQEEGEYMTKKNCHQYAKKFPRYSYIDEYCIGDDCECTYIDELLCENIGCED